MAMGPERGVELLQWGSTTGEAAGWTDGQTTRDERTE